MWFSSIAKKKQKVKKRNIFQHSSMRTCDLLSSLRNFMFLMMTREREGKKGKEKAQLFCLFYPLYNSFVTTSILVLLVKLHTYVGIWAIPSEIVGCCATQFLFRFSKVFFRTVRNVLSRSCVRTTRCIGHLGFLLCTLYKVSLYNQSPWYIFPFFSFNSIYFNPD